MGRAMRNLMLASLACAALAAGPATAADMPVKAKRPVAVTTTYDWSGFYIGGGLGESWTEPHRFMPNLPQVGIPATTFVSNGSDGIYDLHGGLQQQWGQWILGVEASYTAGFHDMVSSVNVSPPEPFSKLSATTRITQLITVGPRLGVAFGPVMAYGTGGYAAARLNGSYSCTDTGIPVLPGPGACSAVFGPVRNFDFGGVTWNDGWYLGGGFEFMAYQSKVADVILGAEYQHFQVDMKLAFTCTFQLCGPTSHQNFLHDARGDIARARLTFKTNGWGFGAPMMAAK
jgi:outer membrane immunogenic protein